MELEHSEQRERREERVCIFCREYVSFVDNNLACPSTLIVCMRICMQCYYYTTSLLFVILWHFYTQLKTQLKLNYHACGLFFSLRISFKQTFYRLVYSGKNLLETTSNIQLMCNANAK